MRHDRLVSACLKRGAVIKNDSNVNKNRFSATTEKSTIVWYKQDEDATCVHWPSPQTDIMTDCFCDQFFHTIVSAAESLGPVVESKPKRKSRKAKRKSKKAKGTSVKELAEAAGLKPGFVLSNPESGDCYTIGTKGRPAAWVKVELAKMAGVPSKVLEASVKVAKSKPKAAKRKGRKVEATPADPAILSTLEDLLAAYKKQMGSDEVAEPSINKVYKIGQRGRKPSWLRDALMRHLNIEHIKKAPVKRSGKTKMLGEGSYRVDGKFHYVGEEAEAEVYASSDVERIG